MWVKSFGLRELAMSVNNCDHENAYTETRRFDEVYGMGQEYRLLEGARS